MFERIFFLSRTMAPFYYNPRYYFKGAPERADGGRLELFCSHLRPLFSLEVKWVPNYPGLGSLHAPLHKLVIYIFLDKGPRSSATALALIEEQRRMRLLYSPVH